MHGLIKILRPMILKSCNIQKISHSAIFRLFFPKVASGFQKPCEYLRNDDIYSTGEFKQWYKFFNNTADNHKFAVKSTYDHSILK